jgi:hypothetical protein
MLSELGLRAVEALRTVVRVAEPSRLYADVRDALGAGTFAAIGILRQIGSEASLKIGTGEDVRGSLDLDGDLIIPADDDGRLGVALDVDVFPRPPTAVEDQFATIGRRKAYQSGLRRTVGSTRGNNGKPAGANEVDELTTVHAENCRP